MRAGAALLAGFHAAVGSMTGPTAAVRWRPVAALVAAGTAIGVLTQLVAPERDLGLAVAVIAAFAVALAVGTKGRPLDFLDPRGRDSIFRSLPEPARATRSQTRRAQLRVILLFVVVGVGLGTAASLVAPGR